jgi:short subunit fatty acids transporter
MLYSIYAIAYLGIYTIYASIIVSFSVLGILFGIVCVAFGYRMAHGLAALTELPTRRRP